jgi:L-serine kinase (ATP) / ParB family transcriptional regulator, heme-responsive regulator
MKSLSPADSSNQTTSSQTSNTADTSPPDMQPSKPTAEPMESDPAEADSWAYDEVHPAGVTVFHHQQLGYHLTLQVVPVEQVVPHEHYHGRRVAELAARLAAEGKLINPPIAMLYKGTYVILDGATRLTALRHMGYFHIIIQVVELERQQVELSTWHHAVRGGSVGGLLEVLRNVSGLKMTPAGGEKLNGRELPAGALGYLFTADKEGFVLEVAPSSAEGNDDWLEVLNRLVAAYGQWGDVERTLVTDMEQLSAQFPDLAALVSFPRFTIETILELAAQGRTVPAGITRFIIPGRILRLNAPLDRLAADESLAEKRAWLDAFVQEKLRARQVRFYEEPVVLLDE